MERMQSYAFSSYACPIRDIPRRAACARRLVALFILERKSKARWNIFSPPEALRSHPSAPARGDARGALPRGILEEGIQLTIKLAKNT
jgi:hypothetical protein